MTWKESHNNYRHLRNPILQTVVGILKMVFWIKRTSHCSIRVVKAISIGNYVSGPPPAFRRMWNFRNTRRKFPHQIFEIAGFQKQVCDTDVNVPRSSFGALSSALLWMTKSSGSVCVYSCMLSSCCFSCPGPDVHYLGVMRKSSSFTAREAQFLPCHAAGCINSRRQKMMTHSAHGVSASSPAVVTLWLCVTSRGITATNGFMESV